MFSRMRSSVQRTLWACILFLAALGVAFAVRRGLTLAHVIPAINPPSAPPGFDAGFGLHPVLTFIHIIAGSLFMILGPVLLLKHTRMRGKLHLVLGRMFFAACLIIGITALGMSFQIAIGGPNETAATTFFALLFLFASLRAFVLQRRNNMHLYHEWLIRTFMIGLSISTTRIIVALFFALSRLSPHEFFGIAFWIGFSAHLVIAELWIRMRSADQQSDADGRLR
jgi:hypothetical protein